MERRETDRRGPVAGVVPVALAVFCLVLVPGPVTASAPSYGYEVIEVYPHDPEAFTQGLVVEGDYFYEGTGLWGESSLRKVLVETGEILKRRDLPFENFGEGVTALRDTIYQLTWTSHVAFSYVELDSFELVETFAYPWEGWGLTHDGNALIASDGSATLRFLDPRTLEEISQIEVHDDGEPITDLNELEYIQGRVYANVWHEDRIAVIDPLSGLVEAWLDLAGLRDSVSSYPDANVLNGIAFDPGETRLFVTGKWWPKVFEINVPPLDPAGADEAASPPNQAIPFRSFPNPAVGPVRLLYTIPREAQVSLRLFDVRGRLLRTYGKGLRPAGRHEVTLDTEGLAPGTYFVRLVSSGGNATTRIVIVK